jgi:uncharacterized protein YbcV (DUF1398 family)
MNKQILEDCHRLAFENKLTFPDSVQRMAETGVERYRADLVRLVKTHTSEAGEIIDVAMLLNNAPSIAEKFDEGGIVAALRTIQRGEIDYPEFLHCIMHAGCTDYSVWINGRKAIYFGRSGDFYVENFLDNK